MKLLKFMSILVCFVLVFCLYFLYEKQEREKFYSENWGYQLLQINKLHQKYGLTGKKVKIALIDTGVSSSIPVNVVKSINVIDGSNDVRDDHGHGTHLAGIVGSKSLGVAPDSELYIVKALDHQLQGDISTIIKAIEWSIDQRVNIILMPFGTFEDSSELKQVIDLANSHQIIIVSSVGNYGLKKDVDITYPAKYDNVIAVGALNKEGEVWKGTTLGEEMDVLLPGQYINSYSLSGGSFVSSGTSIASAYMAGVLALYLENNNEFTIDKVLEAMKNQNQQTEGYIIMNPIHFIN
ncbi:Minor extracellular protease Epr precursor [Bacillus sp. THAF10]|uniref:S8 family serine peptidase n=1 Tax=Bacillus sp. THAF10 TaxID=2587848 RepID=UPI00126805F2|nr:S8 family serine peptidase [Bacillus sp. THAF10]QFT90778.1 Minor extracellular protease Epr precursor [Bacillus sp. THAF10]